jgi:hypothetical protein
LALTDPFIIGTDAPFHFFHAQEVAHGHWPSDTHIAGVLPLLYLIYGHIARITRLPMEILATWVHPILNIATIYLFYIYLRAYAPLRAALVAAYIYSWEYTSFFFGFEFRTQSLAIFFFASYLALRCSTLRTTTTRGRVVLTIGSTAMLIAIGLTAVVSSLLVALLLAAMAVGDRLERRRAASTTFRAPVLTPILVLIVPLTYFVITPRALESTVPYLWRILRSMFLLQSVGNANLKGVYVLGYGFVVAVAQWLLRLLFLAGLGSQLVGWHRGSNKIQAAPLFATCALLSLVVIATLLGSVLSPGRYFQYLSPFFGLYSANLLLALLNRYEATAWGRRAYLVAALFLCVWSISGVLKLPYSLIDPKNDKTPIPARIDRATIDTAQFLIAAFPSPRSSICADSTMSGAIYAVSGRQTSKPAANAEDAARCAQQAAKARPGEVAIVTVDTLASGNLRMLPGNFKLVARRDAILIFARMPRSNRR